MGKITLDTGSEGRRALTSDELADFRCRLDERKDNIRRRRGGREQPGLDRDDCMDPMDMALRLQELNAETSLREKLDLELKLVCGAIERMEAGAYGWCKNCDEAIGYPRLAANPAAVYCLPCQEAYD